MKLRNAFMPKTHGKAVGGVVAELGKKSLVCAQPRFDEFGLGKSRGMFTQFMRNLYFTFTTMCLRFFNLMGMYLYPFSTKLITKAIK